MYATSGVNPSELSRPRLWSDDAWAIVRPRRAFRYIEAHPPDSGTWIALRRPLFLALVLGCGFTLLAAGVLTLRIAASATLYWSFVPLTEVLSLLIVTHRLRRGSASQTIDTFFIGHGPSTLLLLALVATLSILPGERWWNVLTRPAGALGAFVLVAIWAAYVDYCFFRQLLRADRGQAIRSVLLLRVLTWTAVFIVFAVPAPRAFLTELTEALKEVL